MKLGLLLLSAFTFFSAHASDCVRMRSNYVGLENVQSTCLDDSMFEYHANRRDTHETFRNYFRAFVEEVPGFSLLGRILDESSRNSDYVPYMDRQVREELRNILQTYQQNIRLAGNSNDPDSHYGVLQASIQYSVELNKLLEIKNIKEEEKVMIRKASQDVILLGQMMQAKLQADFGRYTKAEQAELNQKFDQLQKFVKDNLKINDLGKLLEKLAEMNEKLDSINSELATLRKDSNANQEQIKKLEREKAELSAKLEITAKTTIQDIKNYAQFAQGMTALYSLFDPAGASKMSAALGGITNMAIAYAGIAELSASAMTSSAAFGYYGLMAAGAVQLFNSFGSQSNGMEQAFKAIFKQLKMISQQITQLQERMDRHFRNMESLILAVERNILHRLEEISYRIDDIDSMVRYSVQSLNDINQNLNELSAYVVNQDIKLTLKQSYLSTVERCLGKDQISVVLKKKELTQCLNDLENFVDKEIKSSLLTRKTLEGQYRNRDQHEWQINDLVAGFNASTNKQIPALANPFLLQDVSDNLKILKKKNAKAFNKDLLKHSVFSKVDALEKELQVFVEALMADDKLLTQTKEQYKSELLSIHSRIKGLKSSEDKKVLDSQLKELKQFEQTLANEIIMRGNAQDEDSKITMAALKAFQKAAEKTRYNKDPYSLALEGKVVLFADNCDPNDTFRIKIPVSQKYLQTTLGENLAARMISNGEGTKLCYSTTVRKNAELSRAQITVQHPNMADVYIKKASTSLTFAKAQSQNCRYAGIHPRILVNCQYDISSHYRGLFLSSFKLQGSINGTVVLHDTFQIDKRIPMYNNSVDQYSLLAMLGKNNYSRSFPILRSLKYVGIEDHKTHYSDGNAISDLSEDLATEMKLSDGGYLMTGTPSTPQNVQNLRNHEKSKAQDEIFETEKKAHSFRIVKSINDFIETQFRAGPLNHAGRRLAAIIFFKGDAQDRNILATNLSETWGLRSGEYLKKFYLDVLTTDTSDTGLEYVLEDQLKHLEAIK